MKTNNCLRHESLGEPPLEERCFYWIRCGAFWFTGIFLGKFCFFDNRLILDNKVVIRYEEIIYVSSFFILLGCLVTINLADKRKLYVVVKDGNKVLQIMTCPH